MHTLRFFTLALLLLLPLTSQNVFCRPAGENRTRQIAIEWHNASPSGRILVSNGELMGISIAKGKGIVSADTFTFDTRRDVRIVVSLTNVNVRPGSGATVVHVKTTEHPFSFFLRDVTSQFPIYLPGYELIVTPPEDPRSYRQIESALKKNLRTRIHQIEGEPEETFESAAAHTRNQPCPTWLGLSRDMRIFELSDSRTDPGSEMDVIRPRNAATPVVLAELQGKPVEYGYLAGRGQGVTIRLARRMEDGVLPILHSTLLDGDIEYRSVSFVSPERSALLEQAPLGTDWLVADGSSGGHMFTKDQEELVKPRLEAEKNKTETTVLYCRVEAVNGAAVPRYAWFKTVRPGGSWWKKADYALDTATGFSAFSSGNVFAISRLNGLPLHDEETALLLKPGEKAVFEFLLPHTPLSQERALRLSAQSFDVRHEECRRFWKGKLEKSAFVSVPEQRISEMVQAGLLQLDLVTYGIEPDGVLAPTIGVYSPIGTESSPIIQFYSSMGLPGISRRSLMFFIEKQHADGMMQNFGGYLVETGAALWSMGEYYRYTRDDAWVRQIESQLLKACDFLLRWRNENKQEALKGKGFGMIAGKVADPDDPFHQYMLNGYGYLGLSRTVEMLKDVDPAQSERLATEAREWKKDIRASLMESIAGSPVVPLGDGRWCPTAPPWPEAAGPRALHVRSERFFSHGTVTTPDALLGPLHLVFCEVFGPEEPESRMMFDYVSELFLDHNAAAFSQPYYSRHDWMELKLGLVKPFLKTYYNTFAALADRETYTFWEHLFQVSAHKTHEQAWFLMQTRWMLYLEEGQTLKLLPGIPRRWLEDGKEIVLKNVQSYFGPLSLRVMAKTRTIEAVIACDSSRKPHDVIIRLPHPKGRKAAHAVGGTYDPVSESVLIRDFPGSAKVRLEF